MAFTVETFKTAVGDVIDTSNNEDLKKANGGISLVQDYDQLEKAHKERGTRGLVQEASKIIKEQANPIELGAHALQIAVAKHLIGAAIDNPQKFMTPILEAIPFVKESKLATYYKSLPEILLTEAPTLGKVAATVVSGGTSVFLSTIALEAFVLVKEDVWDFFDSNSVTFQEATDFFAEEWNKFSNSDGMAGFIGDETFLGNTLSGVGQTLIDIKTKLNDLGSYLGGELYELLNNDVNTKFQTANTARFGDPLVMDLDGDGIETIGADGSVLFDHDADGVKTGTGWAGADDGLLVRDLDGDGDIESGRELFGDNTIKADGTKAKDGFDALSDLDSNADGVFDSSDTAFDEVKVWQDANQDGISQADEMMSLDEAGIANINLNAKTVNQSVDGGILRKTATVTNTDGSTSTVGAMDFAENKFYSEFQNILETSQELQDSINVQGQGALRSLHESASQSPELNELLTGLYSGDTAVTDAAIHDVLLEWAKTSENFTTSLEILDGVTLDDGTQINVGISDRVRTVIEKTAVLEALNGDRLLDYQVRDYGSRKGIFVRSGSEVFDFANGGATVNDGGTVTLNDWDFHRLADNARATNISQGYQSAFNSIKESINTSFIVREVQPFLLENLSFELDEAGDVALSFDGINNAIVEKIKADPSKGLNFYQSIVNAKDVTFLKDGWDGEAIFDNDLFDSIDSHIVDAIEGDVVTGLELINDLNSQADGMLSKNGWDYNIALRSIDFTTEEAAEINALKFKIDGKQIIISTDGDDVINGTNSNDIIYGKDGNDRITNVSGRNILDGGEGDDVIVGEGTLIGGEGNDRLYGDRYTSNTLEGGAGDDTIHTRYRSGNNTIKYSLGDGFDTIRRDGEGNWSYLRYDNQFSDKVSFGEGISQEDLTLTKQGNHLIVTINGDDTQGMKIENFYSTNNHYKSKVNKFEFADGSTLTRGVDDVFNIDFVGDELDNSISGSSWGETIEGLAGNDTLHGGAGNDTLDGGEGNDKLYGQTGNDTLLGGEGNDRLEDYDGRNVLDGGAGDDVIVGEGTLIGGEGNDRLYGDRYTSNTLEGGAGDDTIHTRYRSGNNTIKYSLGDGFDTIRRDGEGNWSYLRYDNQFSDKVSFGEGISQEDLTLTKQGNHLIVTINGDDTQGMKIENFYSTNNHYKSKVNKFEFADGSTLTRGVDDVFNIDFVGDELDNSISGSSWGETIEGLAGNDTLHGGAGNDTLDGGEGNDKLYGQTGNDTLLGGEGNDRLEDYDGRNVLDGGAGDDVIVGEGTLIGGEGNDRLYGDRYTSNTLEGGAGDDTIHTRYRSGNNTIKYSLGDGFDTIRRDGEGNWSYLRYDNQFSDKVSFGEGISQEDLTLTKQGNHLIVTINGDDTQGMKIENFYSTNNHYKSKVNKFEFADGSTLTRGVDDVFNIDFVGDELDNSISGSSWGETIEGLAGNDTLHGGAGNDTLDGGEGNDKLYGQTGNDTLLGGEGNDRLEDYDGRNVLDGGAGDDVIVGEGTLIGGEGNDRLYGDRYTSNTLEGGAGDDTIHTRYRSGNNTIKYSLGDGFDTIRRDGEGNWSYLRYDNQFSDKVSFGEGISQEDLTLTKQGNHLIVTINGDDTQGMKIENFYSTNNHYKSKVNKFEFADGSTLTRGVDDVFNIDFVGDELDNSISGSSWGETIEGLAGNDTLHGGAGNDTLDGGEGNDKLYGQAGNDTLLGGDGNDSITDYDGRNVLDGGAGDDVIVGEGTLIGGEGNDRLYGDRYTSNTLEGGAGDDTIHTRYRSGNNTIKYSLGDGFDTIRRDGEGNWSYLRYDNQFSDKVSFGEGISQEDLTLTKQGNHLIVTINGDDTQGMKIENFYSTNNHYKSKVNKFEFADDSTLTRGVDDVFNIDFVGDELDNSISGSSWGETIEGLAGNDTLHGGAGNDTLDGGEGNDKLYGQAGNDTLLGGDGNDSITDYDGRNVLDGGAGDDVIVGEGTLIGGEGNDRLYGDRYTSNTLEGGAGDDTIHTRYRSGNNTIKYSLGDGFDTIRRDGEGNWSYLRYDNQFSDKVSFGEGISQEDLTLTKQGNHLIVTINGDDTQGMKIENFYSTDNYYKSKVNKFEFADGSTITRNNIFDMNLPNTINGTDSSETLQGADNVVDIVHAGDGDDITFTGSGDDVVYGGDGNDDINAYNGGNNTMYGEAGNDEIGTGAGQDTIDGGSGDDYVESGAGSDIITGGTGDDILRGEDGSDTYIYSQGDGNDTLQLDNTDDSVDTLKLNDIDHDDILFSRDGDDLNISFDDNILGSILVDDYFTEQFNNDGLIIDANDEFQMTLARNANKMAELIAGTVDDGDMDGGSVGGSSQTTTKLNSSQLSELWIPKENI